MFEDVLSKEAITVVEELSPILTDFYLGGGTGLALQLNHRRSLDLDFFSGGLFNPEVLLKKVLPEKALFVREGTLHCEKGGVRLSFLFYESPLIYPPIMWRKVKVADWRDIIAEKFKAISQRGSKKDFYDLYAIVRLKTTIEDSCRIFKERFSSSGINIYHVLKSLSFFEDAEGEPDPILLVTGEEWGWERVKAFFVDHIHQFERGLVGE